MKNELGDSFEPDMDGGFNFGDLLVVIGGMLIILWIAL